MNTITPPGGSMFELTFPGAGARGLPLLAYLIGPDNVEHAVGPIRYRTAWVEKHGDELIIAVYTRIGGPNRVDYIDVIGMLRGRSDYKFDRDDTFDSTFATFRFSVPELIPHLPLVIDHGKAHGVDILVVDGERDTDAMWRDAIAALERGEFAPGQKEQIDALGKQITEAFGG